MVAAIENPIGLETTRKDAINIATANQIVIGVHDGRVMIVSLDDMEPDELMGFATYIARKMAEGATFSAYVRAPGMSINDLLNPVNL